MSKDPYGFEKAKEFLATEEGRKLIEKILKDSSKRIKQRNKDRMFTEEQWRQVYNI